MSDRRYTAILGAAVLTAGVATFSVYRLLRAAAEPRREPTRTVVLVAQDVPAGVPVPREALAQVAWPERVAPPEAFASLDSVAGRVTRVALTQGEPVRSTALAPRGAAPGLEGTIAPDHRAIAVRVNEAAGVSGLVRPNSRVDVLVTSRGDNMGATARLVMADVRVLGVGPARPAEPKDGDSKEPLPANVASIITLEVSPAQAALVAAAEQQGTVQVVLRGFGSRDAGPAGALAEGGVPVPGALPAFVPAGQPAGGPAVAGAPPGFGTAGTRPVVRRPAAGPPAVRVAATHPAPGARAAAVVATPRPSAAGAAPESVTVQVYRGGQLTLLKVGATASAVPVAPPPTPAPTPAPALRAAALATP